MGGITGPITLTLGENNTSVDAGFFVPSASLGDLVFFDTNRNGIQDNGEVGVPNVTVSLLGGLTGPISTTTNASGLYSFTGLTPGTSYTVVFNTASLPSGFTLTSALSGTNTALDSDADPTTGATAPIILAAGENNTSIDAGVKPNRFDLALSKALVSQGPFNPGDNITYTLTLTNQGNLTAYNVVVADMTPPGLTAQAGGSFSSVVSGVATTTIAGPIEPGQSVSLTLLASIDANFTGGNLRNVGEIMAADDNLISGDAPPFDDDSSPGNNDAGEDDRGTADLPIGQRATLGNFVFFDTNGNGVQDTGEEGVPNVTVSLLGGVGGVVSTTTNASGLYSFTGLTPGTSYTVVFNTASLPSGFTLTSALSGTNTALDSDADPTTGATAPIILAAGENNTSIDAGVKPNRFDLALSKALVSQGPFNPGDNITYTLTLTNQGNLTAYNVVVADMTPPGLTAQAGGSFSSVVSGVATTTIAGPIEPGQSVSLTLLASIDANFTGGNLRNVGEIMAADDNLISGDAPPFDDDSSPGNNDAGEDDRGTADLPIGQRATLGNFVFFDTNGNGVQDTGEEGVPNVTVSLLGGVGGVVSTTTNASGLYSFTGLTPGTSYTVVFNTASLPSGFTLTSALSGTNTALDSDADPTTGATAPISLTAGENNLSVDAGVKLIPVYDVAIAKTVISAAPYNAGGQLTYQLTVTNNSNQPVYNVRVNDVLPAQVSFVSGDGFAASGPSSVSALVAGPISASGSVSLTLTAQISPSYSGTAVQNIAVVSRYTSTTDANGPVPVDTTPANNTATVTTPIGLAPVIQLTITDPAVCNPTTNVYSTTGTVTLVNTPSGTLTITDNGVLIATIPVTAGQTSAAFSATGISGSLPASRTLVATLATLTASTTYAVPTSCTVCSQIALAPLTLSNGQISAAYSQTLTATGGTAPYLYIVSAGTLPAGLSLNATTGVLSGTPTAATVANFTVVVSDSKSCTGTAPYSLSVGVACPTDYSIVVSNSTTICNGDSIRLVATTAVPNSRIRWYLTPTGGTAIATVQSAEAITVSPTGTTTYYVEVATADSCKSTRVPVVVTVTTVSAPIVVGTVRNTCPATTANLATVQIQNTTAGLTYEWYTSQTRSQATRVTNLTAVGAGQYYLFAKSGNCYSDPTVVTVNIVSCDCQNPAGVNVGPGVIACSGDLIPLQAALSGSATSVTWSSNGTGTFSSPSSLTSTYTPSAADIASGSVLITATTNDPDGAGVCTPGTNSLLVKINKRPEAPVGVACDDTLVCQGSSTKLIGFAPGFRINWYDQNNTLIGTTESGGKQVVTPSRAGAVVYFAEAVSLDGCVSTTRSSVTVTVGTCLANLAVVKKIETAGPYSIGQKVTYSLTVSNKGKIAATSVKVTDLLPASLGYVSSTPSGVYNAGTGVWTVGSLAVGSDRSLLIETTINAAGSIKNLATVSSPENDPNFALDDTSSVTIRTVDCAVRPPLITCAITEICKGGSTTLQATNCEGGTVRWSDGKTGLTVSVSPTQTTTYTASCVVGSCTSAASNSIVVTVLDPQIPTITASAENVCPGTSVTLTAAGCAGGTIEWSENAQKGASIVVTPNTRTTYTAQCRIGSCLSSPATKTIGISPDLPTPTIVCSTTTACPGEPVTLTVNNCVGSPVWSSTTQTTGSIIVTPTVGNNSYSVYCKNGACVSKSSPVYTIQVVAPVIPTITASADSICAKGQVILTATGCNGTVLWNVAGQTGASITVNPEATTSYYAQCRYRTCLSEPSNTATVTVVTPAAPIIQMNPVKPIICSGEKVVLTADNCAGTVKWYGVNRVGASIEIMPTETMEYYATCTQGSCESEASNKIRITVNKSTAPAPTVAASTTALCNGGVVSLSATGCTGTVLWSDGQTGPIVSVTVTPTNSEFYAVCKTAETCATGKSNTVKVTVTPVPAPTVTCSASAVCSGEEVTLTVNNCQGTPYWSTGETTTTIVVSPTMTTGYSVYCQNGVCKSETSPTYTIAVTPVPVPTIVASASAVEPGGTITLTATGCTGEVIWSANDINGNNKGASIVVRPEGRQTYYAQCRFRECLSDPSAALTLNAGDDCVAKAGTLVATNATVCVGANGQTLISAATNGGLVQPASYSVVYVLTKGPELVVMQTSATPQFNVGTEAGNYTIHTLVYNANPADKNYLDLSVIKPGVTTGADVVKLIADRNVCAELDVAGAKVVVNSMAPPVLSASSPTVCYGSSVTLTAAGCEGGIINWSDGSVGQAIQKTVISDLSLRATCTVNGCVSGLSTAINVTVGTPAIPAVVSSKPSICLGEPVSLTAIGCEGGTYVWSDPASTTSSVLTVTPTMTSQYRVRCKIGECLSEWSAYNTVQVGAPAAPTISIVGATGTSSATVCFGAPVTLIATGCSNDSYVTWSNNMVGNSITVSPANTASYTARCCTSNQCKSEASNAIAIAVLPKVAQPTVVNKTNTCPFNTVDLTTAVTSTATTTGGVFEFYTSASLGLESKVGNPAAVGTGTYYVVEKTANGCYSLPVAIHVQINTCDVQVPCDPQNPATADAGADASICAAKTYQLAGKLGGAGKVAYWTTSGNGTFSNPYALDAVYTASAEDVMSGKVTLTLSVSTNNASCPVATDQMILTVEGSKTIPVVSVLGNTNFCYGDSVRLKAPDGAAGYRWSNNATSQTIVVKSSGEYSVQLLDPKGCTSVKSANVAVNVAEPVLPPIVSNLRNTCPSKIVDLTKALASTNAGSSYIYRICECTTSNVIMRPDSVCEGTYWVVERAASGCVSAPSKIEVKVFNCATDTLKADVSITKTVNTPTVNNGQPVIYTIKVENMGPHTAKNIDVRDVLPKGLELITEPTATYKVSNGVVTKRIDSLRAGQSTSFAVVARVVEKGAIVNKAEITYLDQNDPNLANNSSSVTVQDTSSAKPGLIGLAKAVLGTPMAVGDSLIKVSYGFVVTNFGDDTLRNVEVVDDLAYFFRPNTVVAANVTLGTGSTLKSNANFTGIGNNANMLDSTSYLAPGRSHTIRLDVTVQRTAGDTTMAFQNIASASAINSVTMVSDLSMNGGDSDPDGDGDPTNNTGVSSFTLGAEQPEGPSIGLALGVVKVVKQPDSSYNVTYKATIKNFGTVDLYGISLTDSLVKAFAAPVSYSVVGAPVVGAGSSLVVNANYNGNDQSNLLANTSRLMAGEQDTLLITVNVKPNGNNGPFYSSATVVARTMDSTQTVTDISNSGFDPTPLGSISTAVRFDLPQALLGVAKSVGTPTLVEEGVYDIPYTIELTNLGTVPLKKVQVVDNLSQAFTNGALIVSNRIAVKAGPGLTVDSVYTGQGLITKMLVDSLSNLPAGASSSLSFTVRVNVKSADSLTFYNTAKATAMTESNEVVEDMSTAGTNYDPDNDLDPRNNSEPTPIVLNNLSTTSYIGVAMAVSDTVRKADGSFDVTYQIVVKNYGPDPLTHVALSDSLSKVFNSQTGASYSVVKAPITTSTGSTLKLNTNFDGSADPMIVLGDSTSSLAVGKVDTILVVVNVVSNGSTTTFLNTVYAQARAKTGNVTDVSTNGLAPDLNGNNNPTDQNEREATPLSLPPTLSSIFIPEGFSPNNDGINDLFVIRGTTGLTVSLDVYNRWGHLVYESANYQNDWDGKPNTGIAISSNASGVPDGTYYYVIKTSDGRKFVRYMTINR
ncbi:SdrD B-like domain-containing protein [Spirosoma soli]|uniref:SdrD B-like domain-containing protein n=1 Tax=Spirosoma soli TaxID=1770529 RepID=UPI0036D2EF8A